MTTDRALRRILVLFVVIFAVLAVIAVVAMRYVSASGASTDWVNSTHALIRGIDGVGATVQAGDGAMRAFAVGGDPRDRADSRAAFDEMGDHFDVVKALTRDDPQRSAAVAALETLARRRVDLAEAVWAAREQNQPARVQSLLAADAGSGEMAEIKRAAGRLREEQFVRLAEAEKSAFRNAQTTRWVVWTGLAANIVLLFSVAWLLRDDFAARRLAARTLEEANLRLESEVRDRTSELRSANENLTALNLEGRWANLALEHQLRYNDLIINSVNDLVFVLTRALNVTRVNTPVLQATGFAETDLLNRPLEQVLELDTGGGGTTPLEQIARSLRSGRELRGVGAVLRDRRNGRIPVRVTLLPLRDRDKVVGGLVVATARTDAFPNPR